jgi:hypothetical protein
MTRGRARFPTPHSPAIRPKVRFPHAYCLFPIQRMVVTPRVPDASKLSFSIIVFATSTRQRQNRTPADPIFPPFPMRDHRHSPVECHSFSSVIGSDPVHAPRSHRVSMRAVATGESASGQQGVCFSDRANSVQGNLRGLSYRLIAKISL